MSLRYLIFFSAISLENYSCENFKNQVAIDRGLESTMNCMPLEIYNAHQNIKDQRFSFCVLSFFQYRDPYILQVLFPKCIWHWKDPPFAQPLLTHCKSSILGDNLSCNSWRFAQPITKYPTKNAPNNIKTR